ncbi:TRAP transporter substrate-binding protein [Lachnospiraceae bacterium 62-35]
MKKRILAMTIAAVITAGFTGCGGGSSETTKGKEDVAVTFKMSDQNAEGTTVNIWLKDFISRVEEKTNGTVKIELYPNNTLTSSDLEPCQAGVTDFVQKPPSTATDLDPRMGAFDAPYMYENTQHIEAAFDINHSEAMASCNEVLKDSGLIFLGALHTGNRQITLNKPIYTPADLSGVKIRVVSSDLYIRLLESFGAAATPMAWSEVQTSLLTHVIDGQENPLFAIKEYNLNELQSYVIMTNHMPTNSGLFMNYESWNKLSENQQQAVKDAMVESLHDNNERIADYNNEVKDWLKEAGMTIIDVEDGLDIEAFKERAKVVTDSYTEQWGDLVSLIQNVKY